MANHLQNRVRLLPCLLALAIPLLTAGCRPPGDASVIDRFNAHRAKFNVLISMFQQDGIAGRFSCNKPPDDITRTQETQPVTAERRAEYVELFQKIGCDTAVFYNPGTGSASFPMWSVGMLWAGQGKDIMYIPDRKPTPLVAITDNHVWTHDDHVHGYVEMYKHVEGSWYIHYVAN